MKHEKFNPLQVDSLDRSTYAEMFLAEAGEGLLAAGIGQPDFVG